METKTFAGKIFANTWGYSMTLVDFYEVVSETACQVKLVKIASVETSTGFLCGTAVPSENRERLIERLPDGTLGVREYVAAKCKGSLAGSLKSALGRSITAYLEEWNGVPKYFNHCD